MSLGTKLKEARLRKGFTQQMVADLVGVKKNTITGYEKDDRQPDVHMLKKLISALEVTSTELLELPAFDDSEDNACAIFSEGALRLARLYDRLTEEGQAIIDGHADMIEKHFRKP